MKRIISLIFVILFGSISSVEFTFAQPKSIKIGWTGPLSGPAAEAGVANKQGAILAMEECNAKGGVYVAEYKSKLSVEVLFEDCQSKPEIGVSLGEKLITRDKVHVLFGDAFHSSVTVAMMELAPKYGIPIMSLQPISDEISKKIAKDPARYWSFWKMDVGSGAYARATLGTYQYLIDQKKIVPKNKTIATLVEDTDFGRTVAVRTKELFEGIGWKAVAMETVPLGHTDFYSQLNKIKALDPDILVTLYTALSSSVAMVKQFHEVGAKPSHIAIYYPIRPEFIPQAGKATDYLLFNCSVFDPKKIPDQREFTDKVQKRWKVTANLDMTYGYDGVMNTVDAIERAGSLEPKKIVDALSKLNRKGILGRWVFEQSNHEIKDGPDFIPMPTMQILGGKSEIIWPDNMGTGNYITPPWMK
jgi:branched-chain amino acid transport system substrate-binding protein